MASEASGYSYAYTSMRIYIIHTCKCVYICIYIYMYIYHTFKCISRFTYIYTCNVYIYTYIYTYMCMYTYTHINSPGQRPNGVLDPQQQIISATSYQYTVIFSGIRSIQRRPLFWVLDCEVGVGDRRPLPKLLLPARRVHSASLLACSHIYIYIFIHMYVCIYIEREKGIY